MERAEPMAKRREGECILWCRFGQKDQDSFVLIYPANVYTIGGQSEWNVYASDIGEQGPATKLGSQQTQQQYSHVGSVG